MAQRYRKKPVEIEAVQLRWDNWNEMCVFADVGEMSDGKPQGCYVDSTGKATEQPTDGDPEIGMRIPTLEGVMLARENDWVIRGVQGELYPCKPDIFAATYDEVTA